MKSSIAAALSLLLLCVGSGLCEGPDMEAIKKRLPEKIEALTEAQLTKDVPLSYYFDYPYQPKPGKREWKRVDANTWHEIYPDGYISEFKVLGHTTVEGTPGTIVIKVVGDQDQT